MEIESTCYNVKVSASDIIGMMSNSEFDSIKEQIIKKYKVSNDSRICHCDYSYDEEGYSFFTLDTSY